MRETVSSMLDLAAVEARMAGAPLSWIIVLSFVAVICVVAAWLGLLAAAAFWVTSLGFPAVGALLSLQRSMRRWLLCSYTRPRDWHIGLPSPLFGGSSTLICSRKIPS